MRKPIMGVQLYTVREHCKNLADFEQTIKKIAAIGYPSVQISGVSGVSDADVAKVVEDNGLGIGATHFNWDDFLNDLDGLIEKHRLWKCKHLAIGGIFGEKASPAGLKQFVQELGPVAKKLAANGMDFSYHNHSHEFVKADGKTLMDFLFESTGADQMKFEIDTYWVQHGGSDPALWIRKCKGRIPVLHFKDMTMTSDRTQRFAPVGEGNLNWDSIKAATLESDVEFVYVEQDQTYGADPFECLAASFRNLQKMGLA
jgi:sugar phosphate isomerase/epimerase